MNVYALILNGTVQNTVVWDGQADWSPPIGSTLVRIDNLSLVPGVGWSYNGSAFSPPATPAPIPDLYDFVNSLMTSTVPSASDKEWLEGWLAALSSSLAANDLITIEAGWANDKTSGAITTATINLIISLASTYSIPGIS